MRRILVTLIVIAALFVPFGGVRAAPPAQVGGEFSTITIWAFVDADNNGYYSAGDYGLSDVGACLSHSAWTKCGGTDLGDVWWDSITETGRFTTTLLPETIPAGYKLQSIRCQLSGTTTKYKDCKYNKSNLSALVDIEEGTAINIYYGLKLKK